MTSFARSLHARILVVSAVVSAVALIGTGLLLNDIFKGHIEDRFNQVLETALNDLVAASEVNRRGDFILNWRPSDPRYNTPFSGWYWLIYRESGKSVAVSDSLPGVVDSKMMPVTDNSSRLLTNMAGPDNTSLKALVRKIKPLGGESYHYYTVTGPESDVRNDVDSFSTRLFLSLFLVAIAFLLITLAQLRWILHPLRIAKEEIAKIRESSKSKLSQPYPDEINPLVSEINSLLGDNTKMLERARLQASNLAHAIKNPLAVMRNQSQGKDGEKMRQQIDKLDQNISRHLNRFRIAGLANRSGLSIEVAPVLSDIKHSIDIIYANKALQVNVQCESGLYFLGDKNDLEELLGNLIDNACKWAVNVINIETWLEDKRMHVTISDDGEGVPLGEEKTIFTPGIRLDESVTGQGLGLAIVSDIVSLYGGQITIGKSTEFNVNRVHLKLPGKLVS